MNNYIYSEMEKIFSRRKTLIMYFVFIFYVIGNCLWLYYFGAGFYSRDHMTEINSLNFSILTGKESFFILNLLILPILYIDCLCTEVAERQYIILFMHSKSRLKVLISKWISLMIMTIFILFSLMIITFVFSQLFVEKAEFTLFIQEGMYYDFWQASVFTLNFYSVLMLIMLSVMAIVTFVSTLIRNSILTYLVTIGLMIGAIYIDNRLHFFLLGGESALQALSNNEWVFFQTNGMIIISCTVLSMILWVRRDYL